MRAMMALATAAVVVAANGAALAHAVPPPADQSGVTIPAINHGAMAVLARHRPSILALAARVPAGADPDLDALVTFDGLQRAHCLWLAVPGSLSDEESPLNLCAHAETAGLKTILDRLVTRPGGDAAASELRAAIEWDMVMAGTSLEICEHSGSVFNTAAPVKPDLMAVAGYVGTRHPAVAGIGLTASVLLALGLGLLRLRLQRAGDGRAT